MNSIRTIGKFIGFVTGKIIALCRWVCHIDMRGRSRWDLQLSGWKFMVKQGRCKNQCQIIRKNIRGFNRRLAHARGRHWDRKKR